MLSKRFLMVPLDSSAARIPLPGATIARATSCRLIDPSRDCSSPKFAPLFESHPNHVAVVPSRATILARGGTAEDGAGPSVGLGADEQEDHRVVACRRGDGHHM